MNSNNAPARPARQRFRADRLAAQGSRPIRTLLSRRSTLRVARNANALQDATRTVLAEVDVDNQDGTLAPGMYSIVHLDQPQLFPVVSVPSQAVIFDKDGFRLRWTITARRGCDIWMLPLITAGRSMCGRVCSRAIGSF